MEPKPIATLLHSLPSPRKAGLRAGRRNPKSLPAEALAKAGALHIQKTFDPSKYGMVICPQCNGNGYIRNPDRQCCPKCGGFGCIKKEPQDDINKSPKNPT